jgi:hypothetical protein
MKLKIEHGVPIPPKRGKREPLTITDVMKKMKVGDSMAFPKKNYSSITAVAVYVFGKGGATTRTISPKTCRIWRVK